MDKTILLRLSDISTSYDGKTVFSGVTLDVHAHDFIGIVGPNGGGKTTLVKVLLGLKEVDNGMVERYRNGVVDPSVTIGYLPQYNHIDRMFPISVRDVVLTGLGAQKRLFAHFSSHHETQVDDALQRLDLMSLADRHIAALSGASYSVCCWLVPLFRSQTSLSLMSPTPTWTAIFRTTCTSCCMTLTTIALSPLSVMILTL